MKVSELVSALGYLCRDLQSLLSSLSKFNFLIHLRFFHLWVLRKYINTQLLIYRNVETVIGNKRKYRR